jgi:hypothetical protein
MKAYLKDVIAETKYLIKKRLENTDTHVIDIVLAAYNRYQEDECGGADYIFDITKKDDLLAVVKGGMTAEEIACFWREYNDDRQTLYFFYGVNHGNTYTSINKFTALARHLIAWLDDVVPTVFCYPWVEEYRALYEEFVSQGVKD